MFAFPCSTLTHIEQTDCSLPLSGASLLLPVQSSSMGQFGGDGEGFKRGAVKQE